MRITLTVFLSLFIFCLSNAQVPGVKWQRPFGGSSYDELGAFDTSAPIHSKGLTVVRNGGYVIAGNTYSNDGDVVGNHGGSDILVTRIDSAHNIIWKKPYGGSSTETFGSIKQVGDDGFVFIGSSKSTNGDVSVGHGGLDVWVVRLDLGGNILWQKTLGGTLDDIGNYIEPTKDGGFILAATTSSNNGDVTGFHGIADVWVVKLTSSGIIQWQKSLGGTKSDNGYVVKEVGDNYVVGGTTSSNDGDVVGLHSTATNDVWVSYLDNVGTILWSNTYGGTRSEDFGDLEATPDGGFIVAGSTHSNDGDVSGNHGDNDGWMIKLNSSGSIQWQKCLGGTKAEAFSDIKYSPEGGFVAIGNTVSNDGDISGLHSAFYHDVWVVKVDAVGNLLWSKCLGGSGYDLGGNIFEIGHLDYVTLSTVGSNDGDINGSHGNDELWFAELSSVNIIKGTLFLDQNLNGSKDAGEDFFSNAIVISKSNTDSVSSVPYGGLFANSVGRGNYVTQIRPNQPYYIVVPASTNSSFSSYFNTDSFSFAVQPIAGIRDLQVSLIPRLNARPGFSSYYNIIYSNPGTDLESGEILFKKDPRIGSVIASPVPSSSSGDTLKWTFSNLQPLTSGSIQLTLLIPAAPLVNFGDTLTSIAIINPFAGDVTPKDDTAILKQRVTASFDPNDKIENNGGVVGSDYITDGKYLNYTIRFQNTGTDTAFNVVVRDTLDSKLDWSTFEMVTASNPYTVSITNQNKIEWTFPNINLPDSNVNEPASHGFLSYRVKPQSNATVGDVINNLASIYFDYNLPVLTNNATTLVQDNFTTLPLQLLNFTGQLTNANVQLNWNVSNVTNFQSFEVERSLDGKNYSRLNTVPFTISASAYSTKDNVSPLASNTLFYRLKLINVDGNYTYSKVVVFKINATADKLTIYPNPTRTELFVSFSATGPGNLLVKILDASGRTMVNTQTKVQKGNNVFPLRVSQLKAGNYILQISANGQTQASKFTVMD